MSLYTLATHPARPYLAIRIEVPMSEIGNQCPPLIGEVMGWMGEHGIAPAGPPLFRYLAFGERETIDVGFPVAQCPAAPGGKVIADSLPAGRYAVMLHRGPYAGLHAATKQLLDTLRKDGLAPDLAPQPGGQRWGGFVESYLTDPRAEPDESRWLTEVSVRLADG